MTDPIQIKHYKEDITSFNQLYKEFQRRFVRFANTYVNHFMRNFDAVMTAFERKALNDLMQCECSLLLVCSYFYGLMIIVKPMN